MDVSQVRSRTLGVLVGKVVKTRVFFWQTDSGLWWFFFSKPEQTIKNNIRSSTVDLITLANFADDFDCDNIVIRHFSPEI